MTACARVAGRVKAARLVSLNDGWNPECPADRLHRVSFGFQGGDGGFAEVGIDQETPQARWGLAERSNVVIGAKTTGNDRGIGGHSVVDIVHDQLEGGLVLAIATGDADRQHGTSGFEDQSGGEGDAWAFAGDEAVGAVWPIVKTLEAGV